MNLLIALLVSVSHPLFQEVEVATHTQSVLTVKENPNWEYLSDDNDVAEIERGDGMLILYFLRPGVADVTVFDRKTNKPVWDTIFTVKNL